MAFVVSQGRIMGLQQAPAYRASNVRLTADFSADYATLWKTQPHVRTVVSFLARNIAQLGLHVFERVSDVDRRRLTDHPLAALIAKPNPRTTRYRFIDALVNDLGIYDVACWAKVNPGGGSVGALLRLPPRQIEPIGDSWAWPDGIRFLGNKGRIDFTLDQVVLFRGYNPTDSRWGVSPMETLRQVLAEEFQATQYREQLWRNGARFPGHIERPAGQEWSDKARERFREDWRGLYTGNGPGAGGTPVLEDGMAFKVGGITPAQAQYLETRKLTREEVAAAFHIPLPMVGILDHATFSNIEEQHKNLYQDTLGPWLEMIQQEIGLQLLPDLDGTGKVYVEFNLSAKLKGSFDDEAQSLQTAVGAPWLTRNEARARQNLPQIEGGDALVTPLNVLEGGQASPTDSAPKGSLPQGRLDMEPAFSQASRLSKARAAETYVTKHEQVLKAFFRRQAAAVQSLLGAKADADWWDGERWDKELAGDLYRLAVKTSETVAKSVLEGIGFGPDEYDVDRTLAFLAAVAQRIGKSINATTKAQIQQALSADEPTEAVANVFEVGQTSRTAQIAATTVTAWSGFATVEAAKQSGATTKTWLTGPNPRASHAAMNGETVGIEEPFSNGLMWPGDGGDPAEVAGCNCDVSINTP